MGEGLHLYKINGKYFMTSAWFTGEMRMPTARASSLDGPWEVNQEISRGEDFGFVRGNRLAQVPRGTPPGPPYKINPANPAERGRNAIHQGGIVDTPTGEWWGFSMMDANSVGRLTCLSPVTWNDGWPYFGLPGNLGRTPRTWVKPNTGVAQKPAAPYRRSDEFSQPDLQPVWQWNHVPVDGKWSLRERPGFLRLHALPAESFWRARNTLTQRAMGPRSTVTVVLETGGLKPGMVAGFGLFNRPYAWLGLEHDDSGLALTFFDEQTSRPVRSPFRGRKVWLRAECDFLKEIAQFSYSTDGKTFQPVGGPWTMVFQLTTFQGIRYSLFAYTTRAGAEPGYADFDSIDIQEPTPKGLTKAIPIGKQVHLRVAGPAAVEANGSPFAVIDRKLGRVALRTRNRSFLSVAENGSVSLRQVSRPGVAETFQWMETFTGELILMSLTNHRYLRLEPATATLSADSIGPRADGLDGVRFTFEVVRGR